MSATPSPCDTQARTGTSMACPAVAGVGMLVRQYFMDGYYPTGSPDPEATFTNPSGALLKATLLNSAVDMTGISGYPSDL
ncbi:MAG: S8 family serine peptidase, partial [Planctomycetales bacterium]|nr:S8 family serine peptidase [Planctomycetales bacterium]